MLLVLYTDTLDALETVEQTFSPTLPADKAAGTKAHLAGTLGAQSDADRETWGAGQSYIALGYLLLLAETMGLGTSPMLGFDPEKVKEMLGLPSYARVPALIALGHPAEEGFVSSSARGRAGIARPLSATRKVVRMPAASMAPASAAARSRRTSADGASCGCPQPPQVQQRPTHRGVDGGQAGEFEGAADVPHGGAGAPGRGWRSDSR